MTIFIEREVTANPSAVELPATIDLCTALRSDRDERVSVGYRLAEEHAVWFGDESGQMAKAWAGAHDVGQSGGEHCDTVRLVSGPGRRVASVRIELVIEGQDNEESTVCRLTLLRRSAA